MRKISGLCIKIIIAAIFLSFLVHKSVLDLSLLPLLLKSPGFLILTFALYFIVFGVSTWRWHELNKTQKIHLPYLKTLLPTYLGIAFNNLLPGGVGGDFYRFYYLNKAHSTKKTGIMLSIFIDRITGLLGMCIVAAIAIVLEVFKQSKIILFNIFPLLTLMIISGIIIFVISYYFLSEKTYFRNWLLAKYPQRRLSIFIISLLDTLIIYRDSKLTIAKCLLASTIIQLLIALTCLAIASLMNYPAISMTSFLLAVSVTQLVNLIPVSPGGLGIGEIAFANIILLLNPDTTAPFATIFMAYRILGLITYIPAFAIFIFDRHQITDAYASKGLS